MKPFRFDRITLRGFRYGVGLTAFFSFLFQISDWVFLYSGSGMIDRSFRSELYPSLLFFSDSVWWPLLLGSCLCFFLFKFVRGDLSRIGFVAMLLLQISFHNANPLIIHEPQQILNFLLASFLFLPLDDETEPSQGVLTLLLGFLGVYYLAAGVKKLPDPMWWSGEAFGAYLRWEALGKENALTQFILWSGLDRVLGWFALVYELLFLVLCWTRARAALFVTAVVFHLGIWLCLDVGHFGLVMIAWCTLLLNAESRERFRSLFNSGLSFVRRKPASAG